MRKIRLKFAISEIDGTLYEVGVNVPRQEEEGTNWKPSRNVHTSQGDPSEAQKEQRQLFKDASGYAMAALADPELCAYYEAQARKQGRQPRPLAMSDYLNGKNLLAKE